MECKILIKYREELIQEMSPNTPSLEKLKKYIIQHKNDLDVSLLTCACENANFDLQTFEGVLKSSIEEELEKLKLDQEHFDDAYRRLNNEQAER